MRVFVVPRPHQSLDRRVQILHQMRHRVAIPVMPAAHAQHRRLDRTVILANRTVLPVIVPQLMLHPFRRQKRRVLQPLQPHLAPALPHDLGVRRQGKPAQHGCRPAGIFAQHQAALVMDVVRITVRGGTDADHRLQRLRRQRGDLQSVEPAPADSHHAHAAAAPALRGQPVDHRHTIGQFLFGILVVKQSLAVTATAHVNPYAGVSMPGQIGMGQRIAHRRAVALAIGQVFQDRWHRTGTYGPPYPRRQIHTVGHGNGHMRRFLHLEREVFDNLHEAPPKADRLTSPCRAVARAASVLQVGLSRPARCRRA